MLGTAGLRRTYIIVPEPYRPCIEGSKSASAGLFVGLRIADSFPRRAPRLTLKQMSVIIAVNVDPAIYGKGKDSPLIARVAASNHDG